VVKGNGRTGIHMHTGSGKVSGMYRRNSYLHAVACIVSCLRAPTLPVILYAVTVTPCLPSQCRAGVWSLWEHACCNKHGDTCMQLYCVACKLATG
jgi:hypothetical protein